MRGLPRVLAANAAADVWPAADVVFASDWKDQLGTYPATMDPVTPGGSDYRWSTYLGHFVVDQMDVIEATGLGFPASMAKVMRVPCDGLSTNPVGGGRQQNVRYTGLPVPAIGESLYFRMYERFHTYPSGTGSTDAQHGEQDGNAIGDINWARRSFEKSATTYGIGLRTEVNAFPNNRWGDGPTYTKGVTYRWEWRIHRVGTSSVQYHVRVYGADDTTLLFDDDDFANLSGGSPVYLSSNPTLSLRNVANLNGLNVGTNGWQYIYTGIIKYVGGVCVRTQDWCGPYRNGV